MGRIRIITKDKIDFPEEFGWLSSYPYIYHGFIREEDALDKAKVILEKSGAVEVILVKDDPIKGLVNIWRKVE